MARYYIKSLSIEGFRGINNNGNPLIINFQAKGITSIFGENGKGKSSIFEALVFAIMGRIIRLDEYHQDIKDKRAIKNLFHPGNGTIKIEFTDESGVIKDISVQVDVDGNRTVSSVSVSDPEKFLSALCSSLNFLDYKSFEKIMLTSSEETGKLFSNLVGFGNFIHVRDKLDKITRTQILNNDFGKTVKETRIQTNTDRIQTLKSEILTKLRGIGIQISNYDENLIKKHLKAFLRKEYSISISSNLSSVDLDFDELVKSKIGEEYEINVARLNSQEKSLIELNELRINVTKFNGRVVSSLKRKLRTAYSKIESSDDIVLGKLYDNAIDSYNSISDLDKNTCVLCDTENLGNERESFYERIVIKVRAYLEFKSAYTEFNHEFIEQVTACKIIEAENQWLDESNNLFSNSCQSLDFFGANYFSVNNLTQVVRNYNRIIKNKISEFKSNIRVLKSQIPPKIAELVEINNSYKLTFNSVKEITELENENKHNSKYLAELENWTTFVNGIKEEYEEAFNVLMEDIAAMIDTDTKVFFKDIMKNDEITPKLRKEQRGQKVNILLEKFYTNTAGVKAAPLLSESFRNALCLSIYFAAALKSKSEGNFIVVDDITSSFDSGHQLFLLDLIRLKIALGTRNKVGKQVLFLTHDGLLKKALNRYQQANPTNWKHYSLNSNQDVVSLTPITSSNLRNSLIAKINSGSYDDSGLRVYYEAVLIEIIEELDLEIPYSIIHNNDQKMVNNLVKAIAEIVELKVKSGRVRANLVPTHADFTSSIDIIANHLSHWADGSAMSQAPTALIGHINDIDALKRKFQYNCTCMKNLGLVYYRRLSRKPKHKGCTCTI